MVPQVRLESRADLATFTPVCLPSMVDYTGRDTTVIG